MDNKLLGKVMAAKGYRAGHNTVSKIIKNSGYRFRKAREILTSNDPHYRDKLRKITSVLSRLGPDERFFSIDEFGPFSVKKTGGRRLAATGEYLRFRNGSGQREFSLLRLRLNCLQTK